MGMEDEVSTEIETHDESETTETVEETTDESQTEESTEEAADDETEAGEEGAESEDETEEEGGESKEQAFKPNVKFKVLDKEMEIPKEYHGLMKDAESEKAVKELFEKAHGLDSVKSKLNDVRAEKNTLSEENHGFRSFIGKARQVFNKSVETGNLHGLDQFFQMLDVPTETIMQYAIEKAKLSEMDPAQRQLVEGQLKAQRDAEAALEGQQSLQNELHQQTLSNKELELTTTLAKPEVSQLAEAFDSKFGQPGLFAEEVIAAGENAWFKDKKNLSVGQAIERVVKKYRLLETGAQAQTTVTANQNQNQSAASKTTQASNQQQAGAKRVIAKSAPTTLPNVGGSSGSSPLKTQKPRSIDDIKKLRDRVMAGEQV